MSITLAAVVFSLVICLILTAPVLVILTVVLTVLIILVIVIIVLHSGHLLLFYADQVRTTIMSEIRLLIPLPSAKIPCYDIFQT